jgi:cytochrome P450
MAETTRVDDSEVIEKFVEHFDHQDPVYAEHTHEVLAEMIQRCPVAHSDNYGGYWVITGYEQAHYAMHHYETFNRFPSSSVPAYPRERPMLPIEVDPPIHSKYRGLLAPVFAPPRIAALEPRIREVTSSLIDAFADKGECELIVDFADPLPITIFTEMLGLPTDEWPKFRNWKNTIMHTAGTDPSGAGGRIQAVKEVQAYFAELLEDRKRERQDDIISVLLDSTVDGEKLTDQEVLDITDLLFLAGLDTVAASLGLHFLFLAQSQEHRKQLVEHPELMPLAVEELLRYESLVTGGYTLAHDFEFYGAEMKKGDRAVVSTIAADRDPKEFPNPDVVDFERTPNRHIAFGAGPHRCVGSHLARLELKIAYEEMFRRIPDFRLAPGGEVKRHGSSVQGIDHLPLVWDV